MKSELDVIVHGICTTDIIFTELPSLPPPGEEVYAKQLGYSVGGSFITAVTLARLGKRVGVICPLGTDQFSDVIRQAMIDEGIVSLAYETNGSQVNVSVCMSQGGERAIVSYSDPLSTAKFMEHTLDVLDKVKTEFLHISATRDAGPAISCARSRGIYVSMDIGWDEAWLRDPEILRILEKGNLFIPNEREASAIADTDAPEKALQFLQHFVPNVIVKCGPQGALCSVQKGDRPCVVDPILVEHVVDTIGAGDNFDAGVLYGLLQRMSLQEAVLVGNFCGAESLHGIGGTGHTANIERLQTYLHGQTD